MRTLRCVTLIVSLSVVAVTLVYLRWEQTRIASGLLHAETRWVELRRDWWSVQANTARFRSPARMRGRAGVVHDGPRLLVQAPSELNGLSVPTPERFGDVPRYE